MKIKTGLLRAALAVAPTINLRPQINGVHIAPDGSLRATDGHQAVVCYGAVNEVPDGFDGITMKMLGKLPTKCKDWVTLDFGRGVIDHGVGSVEFSVVDLPFPDTNRVIPQGPTKPIDSINIDANLFKNIQKVFGVRGFCGVRLDFRGPDKAVVVSRPDKQNILYFIMPCRP